MDAIPLDDLRRARRGDREALARLLERNEERLRDLAELRLGHDLRARVRVSDVLQSTYLSALRYISEFDGEDDAKFTAWLIRILENNVREKGRFFGAAKRQREIPLPPHAEQIASVSPDPATRVAWADEFRVLAAAFDALPVPYRRVLFLRMVERLPYEEVAAVLERSSTACRTLFHRARAALAVECDKARKGTGGRDPDA